MFPARLKRPFGGDISLAYLRHIYEWELGSRGGGEYFAKCLNITEYL